MPSPMVHFKVARDFIDHGGFTAKDLAQYYLGALSPDAVHARENYTRKYKDISHLMTDSHQPDRMELAPVKAFLQALSPADGNYAFRLGYAVHLLTDYYWFETLYDDFKKSYAKDASPVQELTPAYYNDTDQAEAELYRHAPWRVGVWNLLEQATPTGIDGLVSAEETGAWRDRTLTWFDTFDYARLLPVRYITTEKLDAFYEDAVLFLFDTLHRR